MSRYLNWLVLNDGVFERVTESDIDATEEAAVIDRCLLPLTLGEVGHAGGRSGPYSVRGEITAKHALLRLYDEDAPLADLGICLHSRNGPRVWRALHDAVESDLADVEMPAAPWCAVICYAPEDVLPRWFDQWTKTAAFALLRREGW